MLGINNDLPLIIIIISSLVCINDFLVKHVFLALNVKVLRDMHCCTYELSIFLFSNYCCQNNVSRIISPRLTLRCIRSYLLINYLLLLFSSY